MSNVKTREIKTKFSIEGEKQLKSALSENAAQAKELKSEMALLDAKFADATDSEEYLAEKAEILAKQIQTAEDKVGLYEDALEKAVKRQEEIADALDESRKKLEQQEKALEAARKEYGDGSEQVQKLTDEIEYNKKAIQNQESQLSKANKSVSDYKTSTNYAQAAVEKLSKAQEESADESQEMSGSLSEIADKLGIELPDGVSKALDSIGSLSSNFGGAATGSVAAIGLIVAGLKELWKAADETGDKVRDIVEISNQFGISTDTVQQYEYASQVIGVSMDSILDAHKRVVEIQGEVVSGNEEYSKTMEELGVSIYDANGKLKDSQTVLFDLVGALGSMTSEEERAITASQLFGDQFTQLIPILQDGGNQFRTLMQEAEKSGYVLGEQAVQATNEYAQATKKLELEMEGTIKRIGALGADFFEPLIENVRTSMSVITEIFVATKRDVGQALDWRDLFKAPDMSAYKNALSGMFGGFAAGTPSAPGGVATVGEYGPERVILPKGSQVMNARDTEAASGGTVNNYFTIQVPNLEKLREIVDYYDNMSLSERSGSR